MMHALTGWRRRRRRGARATARCALALALAGLLARSAPAQQPAAPPAPGGCQVHISTLPAGAVIAVDGRIRNVAPLTLSDLAPGTHLISASKQGYREARRTIEVHSGDRLAVELKLDALTGLVLVTTDPPGAMLEIEGADRGRTPLLVTDLPFGRYRVRFSTEGYAPKVMELLIENRAPILLHGELVSDSATLVVVSQPPGARVLLNGIPRGTTPCTLDRIPEGDCTIELQREGYQPHKRTLKLYRGQRERLALELEPKPAALTVVSIPAGARVYVGEQFRGESPLTLDPLEPGAYRVRVEKENHEPLTRTVQLAKSERRVEEFRLEANVGSVELTTQPAGVKVFVDGKLAGVTLAKPNQTDQVSEPLLITDLAPGVHELELTCKGYFALTLPLVIERDRTQSRHVALKRRFIPNCEVRTATDVYRGVLLLVDPEGNVKLEVRPGIVRTIPAADVRSRVPLRTGEEDEDAGAPPAP